MRIKVSKIKDFRDLEKMHPNMIYNRFDLFEDNLGYEAVQIRSGKEIKIVEYRITEDKAELGIWLMPITPEELDQLFLYIHDHHPAVTRIFYKNALVPCGKSKAHNHFRIVFPETVDEIEHSISSKSRAKMRKKLQRAQEIYGEMRYVEYDRSNIPEDVVEHFFKFKLATRGRVYNMTANEYLDRYHVSHCYVLKFGDIIGAIRFSCEQCPVVYGENFTFNPELKDYSLGRAIFMHHLIRMVEKKHSELFFAGGNFEYKTHYGSIEETLYDCEVTLANLNLDLIREQQTFVRHLKNYMKAHLPEKTVKMIITAKKRLRR